MLDNATYNLMESATVLSKGLHRYQTYHRDGQDCPDCRQIWQAMWKSYEEQLGRVLAHLTQHMTKAAAA